MPKGLEAINVAQGITNQIMTLTMDMSERIIELEQINARLMESESEMFGELQHQDKEILKLKKENAVLRAALGELSPQAVKLVDAEMENKNG